MDNFIFGAQSIMTGLNSFVKSIMDYQLFWGFGFGFLISTFVHGFLTTGSARDIPSILFQDKAKSFEKVHARHRKEDGTYTRSFMDFMQLADVTKFLFSLSFFMFSLMILLSLISLFRV